MKGPLLSLLCLAFACFSQVQADFRKICYFTSWSQYRIKIAEFSPSDIDPFLCTHLVFSYVKIKDTELTPTNIHDFETSEPGELSYFDQVLNLRKVNNDLKILVSVDDINEAYDFLLGEKRHITFENVVKDEHSRQEFSRNSIDFLRKWRLDGLIIDWKYPKTFGNKLTQLLESFRIEFETESIYTSKPTLTLGISVSALKEVIDASYEIENIANLVDFINLRAFDFHDSVKNETSFHSPLYADRYEENELKQQLNVDWAVNYWIKKGCPSEKLNLGIGFYGRGFKLSDPLKNTVGSPKRYMSSPGKFIQEAGFVSYFEVCHLILTGNAITDFNEDQKVPSIQVGLDWIGYENEKSLAIKAEYVRDKCLGGVAVWSIDMDDFKNNICNAMPYPLLRVVNEYLDKGDLVCSSSFSNSTETETKKTTTTTTVENTIVTPIVDPIPEEVETTEETEIFSTTENTPVEPEETTPPEQPETTPSPYVSPFLFKPFIANCQFFQVFQPGIQSKRIGLIKCPTKHLFDKNELKCLPRNEAECGGRKVSERPDKVIQTSVTLPTTESTTTSKTSVTNGNVPEFDCADKQGRYAHASECNMYWVCDFGVATIRMCPSPLVFNPTYTICDYTSSSCPIKK